jgi:hypothetical protein
MQFFQKMPLTSIKEALIYFLLKNKDSWEEFQFFILITSNRIVIIFNCTLQLLQKWATVQQQQVVQLNA